MELAKDHVRVNSVHPGGVDTKVAQAALPAFEPMHDENPVLFGMTSQWIPGVVEPREI